MPAYQKPAVIATLAALAGTFLIASLMLLLAGNEKNTRIGVLEDEIKSQPLLPAQSTRTFTLHPSRSGPPVGGHGDHRQWRHRDGRHEGGHGVVEVHRCFASPSIASTRVAWRCWITCRRIPTGTCGWH